MKSIIYKCLIANTKLIYHKKPAYYIKRRIQNIHGKVFNHCVVSICKDKSQMRDLPASVRTLL